MQHPAENPVSAHRGDPGLRMWYLLFSCAVTTNAEFSAIHLELLRTSLLSIIIKPTQGKPRAIILELDVVSVLLSNHFTVSQERLS